MKIAILSRNAKLYSTARLVEAARRRGHRARVLDPLRCYMRIAPSDFSVHYKGRAVAGYDAVIPRVGASITFYGTAVLRQFEMMGVYTPNSSDAILRARDKLRCLQLLAREGIGLPSTVFGDNPDDTADLLAMLGEPPHVIKLVEGAQGNGVLLAEKRSASQSVIVPTPAAVRNCATGAPSPPTPTISACAEANRVCASGPSSSSRMCRL